MDKNSFPNSSWKADFCKSEVKGFYSYDWGTWKGTLVH